jgi:hypothetical protein
MTRSPLKAAGYLPGDKGKESLTSLTRTTSTLEAATSSAPAAVALKMLHQFGSTAPAMLQNGGNHLNNDYSEDYSITPEDAVMTSPPRTASTLFPAHVAAEKKGLSAATDTGLAVVKRRYEGPVVAYPGLPIRESREAGVNALPVRSVISPYHESMQHMIHLRMKTPYDPPDMEPYSLVMKNVEREKQIQAVKEERQTKLYKFVSMVVRSALFGSYLVC